MSSRRNIAAGGLALVLGFISSGCERDNDNISSNTQNTPASVYQSTEAVSEERPKTYLFGRDARLSLLYFNGSYNGDLKEEILPFNQRNIIVAQRFIGSIYNDEVAHYVVVPGYVAEGQDLDFEKTPSDVRVESIKEDKRQEAEAFLKERGYKGPINFW